MTRSALRNALPWAILLLPVLYLSTCSNISDRTTTAFDTIEVGDSEDDVVRVLGKPSVRERAEVPVFFRYASAGCVAPCNERLWYENRLGMVGEAWSIELGADRRVIHKSHWMSP